MYIPKLTLEILVIRKEKILRIVKSSVKLERPVHLGLNAVNRAHLGRGGLRGARACPGWSRYGWSRVAESHSGCPQWTRKPTPFIYMTVLPPDLAVACHYNLCLAMTQSIKCISKKSISHHTYICIFIDTHMEPKQTFQ